MILKFDKNKNNWFRFSNKTVINFKNKEIKLYQNFLLINQMKLILVLQKKMKEII